MAALLDCSFLTELLIQSVHADPNQDLKFTGKSLCTGFETLFCLTSHNHFLFAIILYLSLIMQQGQIVIITITLCILKSWQSKKQEKVINSTVILIIIIIIIIVIITKFVIGYCK